MSQNLSEGFTRTVGNVKDKVQRVQESMKLKSKISDLQREKLNHLVQLGAMAYRSLRAGDAVVDDLFREKAKEILNTDIQIAALDRELTAVEAGGKNHCPHCGKVISTTDKFCTGCGANLLEGAEEQSKCRYCESSLQPDARFCSRCGSPTGGM